VAGSAPVTGPPLSHLYPMGDEDRLRAAAAQITDAVAMVALSNAERTAENLHEGVRYVEEYDFKRYGAASQDVVRREAAATADSVSVVVEALLEDFGLDEALYLRRIEKAARKELAELYRYCLAEHQGRGDGPGEWASTIRRDVEGLAEGLEGRLLDLFGVPRPDEWPDQTSEPEAVPKPAHAGRVLGAVRRFFGELLG